MVAPESTPPGTTMVPSGLMAEPAGAPTRLSCTLAGAGGVVPLRLSLASTLAVVPPAAMPLKLSSAATRVPVLTLRVAVAVPHTAVLGDGRQAW